MDRSPRTIQPPANLGELHQRLLELTYQLDRGRTYLKAQSVSASEARIVHGGRTVPKHVSITARSNVTAYLSTGTVSTGYDATYVYIIASGSGTVDLEVVF